MVNSTGCLTVRPQEIVRINDERYGEENLSIKRRNDHRHCNELDEYQTIAWWHSVIIVLSTHMKCNGGGPVKWIIGWTVELTNEIWYGHLWIQLSAKRPFCAWANTCCPHVRSAHRGINSTDHPTRPPHFYIINGRCHFVKLRLNGRRTQDKWSEHKVMLFILQQSGIEFHLPPRTSTATTMWTRSSLSFHCRRPSPLDYFSLQCTGQ